MRYKSEIEQKQEDACWRKEGANLVKTEGTKSFPRLCVVHARYRRPRAHNLGLLSLTGLLNYPPFGNTVVTAPK